MQYIYIIKYVPINITLISYEIVITCKLYFKEGQLLKYLTLKQTSLKICKHSMVAILVKSFSFETFQNNLVYKHFATNKCLSILICLSNKDKFIMSVICYANAGYACFLQCRYLHISYKRPLRAFCSLYLHLFNKLIN